MKRHILLPATALMMAVAAGGCSDDLTEFEDSQIPEGCIRFSVALPAPISVSTRADVAEYGVNSLTALLYNENGTLIQSVSTTDTGLSDDGDNKYTLTLNETAKSTPRLIIHVVANADVNSLAEEESDISDLMGMTENSFSSADLPSYIVMAGHTEAITQASLASETQKISLYRNVAKSTVTSTCSNFRVKSFRYCDVSDCGYILPYESTEGTGSRYYTDRNGVVSNGTPRSVEGGETAWFYPTENTGTGREDNHPYLLVEGDYRASEDQEWETSWYKLELVKKENSDWAGVDNNNTDFRIDLQANHNYEVSVVKVTAKGYATAEEAADGQAANLSASGTADITIIDEVEEVLSMIADTSHELGVSSQIVFRNEGVARGEDPTEDMPCITVKVCGNVGEINTLPTLGTDNLPEWLEVGEHLQPESVTDINGVQSMIYRFPLIFVKGTALGRQTTEIPVSWCGLTRTVEVAWERNFSPDEICTATLTVKEGSSEQYVKTDYWSFLADELKGASETANGPEMARNEGFHFPMPYGTGEPWTYTYDLTFPDASAVTIETLAAYSDNVIRNNIGIQTSGNKATLTFNSKDAGYTYGTGILKVTLTRNGAEEAYTFNVYHTGFFHEDTGAHRIASPLDDSSTGGFLYYEVVSMGDSYWLDRNVGATSRGMDIIDDSGNHVISPEDSKDNWPFVPGAAGGYYELAKSVDYSSDVQTYTDICPPGYHVPAQDEWLSVRNSSNFHRTTTYHNNIAYISSEYIQDASTPHAHTIYFPKVRYLNGSVFGGEGRAGYYWTATQATGLEKDQIGKWFKALYIAGNSTSYVFGSLDNFRIPVRAIAGNSAPTIKNYTIALSAQNATHVYLYTVDANGNRQGLMNWPGQAITTYANTGDNKWANFTYTTTINPEETPIGIIFNYLASNGRIVTMGAGPDDTTPNDSNPIQLYIADQTRTTARGWRYTPDIKGGQFKFYIKDPTADIVYWIHRQPSDVQFMEN